MLALAAGLAACGGPSDAESVEAAKTALAQGDHMKTLIGARAALQKNPANGQARYLLGEALLAGGDGRGGQVELTKARELGYDAEKVVPALGRAMLATGQVDTILNSLAAVELQTPVARAQLKNCVAVALLAKGKPDEAKIAFAQALADDPKNAPVRLMSARFVAGAGDIGGALRQVEAVIADEPKMVDAWLLKGDLLRTGRNDVDGAKQAYQRAIDIDPRTVMAYTSLLQMLLERNDVAGFKTQIEALRKALPDSFETRYYTAQQALLENNPKRALEISQQLLRLTPDYAPVLQLAGTVALRTGAVVQAQRYLVQAVQLAPDVPTARRLLAQAYLQGGQLDKAVGAVQPLIEGTVPDPEALTLAAQAQAMQGNYAKAEGLLVQAIKAAPNNTKNQVALAVARIGRGNVEAGLAQLQQIAASDKEPFADLALIDAYDKRGNADAALKAVAGLRAKLPKASLPDEILGRLLLKSQDSAAAKVSFERALAIDPGSFSAARELAVLYLEQSDIQAARKLMDAAVARDPGNVAAALAVVSLRQRAGASDSEVETALNDIIKAHPDEVDARLALTEHLLRRRQAKAALLAAQQGLNARPDDWRLIMALGRAQFAAGDQQQALKTFHKVAEALPGSPDPMIRLAEQYEGMREYQAAAGMLRRVLETTPAYLPAQTAQIRIALARKDTAEALRVAREVRKQRPREATGWLMEAEVNSLIQAFLPAAQAFKAAYDIDPSLSNATKVHAGLTMAGRAAEAAQFAAAYQRSHPKDAEMLFYLGTSAMGGGDMRSAEAYFRQALEIDPDSLGSLNNLAIALLKQNKPGAVALAERANKLRPGLTSLQDTLAMALASDKQWSKALELQRQVVSAQPSSAGYRLNLARILVASGDKAAARTELDKLAALGGQFAGQAEVAALLKTL